MNPPAVSVQHVSQQFSLHHEKTLKGLFVNKVLRRGRTRESFLALDDIDLEIGQGETVGLIGHNGSGKSTLLKIIGGVMTPTRGRVVRRGRLAALLELRAGFHGDLTGRENVLLNSRLLGLSAAEIKARFDEIVAFSGVESFIDTPMKYYSSGMFVRLGFALAINTDPDVLLVDEVLAVGDEQFQARCLSVMRTFQDEGRTIVLVSHNSRDIVNFCQSATLLHEGRIRSQGDPETALKEYRRLLAHTESLRQEGARPESDDEAVMAVQVGDTRVWTGSGTPLDQFRRGDSLNVEATFVPLSQHENFVGRLLLFGEGGQFLHGTSTQRLGVSDGPLRDPLRVRFTLPDLDLGGGRYRIAVEAAPDRTSRPWHRVADAAFVYVPVEPERTGPMRVRTTAAVVGGDDVTW